MGNRVEVLFEASDLNVADTAQRMTRAVSSSASEIAKAWREVELVEDRVAVAAEGGMRRAKRAAKEYADSVLDAKLRVEELERQQERIQKSSGLLGRDLPINFSQRAFQGAPLQTGGTGVNAGLVTEADAFKFREQQVAFQRQLRFVTQDGRGADNLQKTAQGLSTVRSALLGSSGIPRGEAVGGLLDLAGAGGKLSIGIGAAAIGFSLIDKVFVNIRENSELIRRNVEKASVVKQFALGGGLEDTKNNILELRKLNEDVRKLIGIGDRDNAQRLIAEKLGPGANAAILQSLLGQAELRARQLGLDNIEDPKLTAKIKQQQEERERLRKEANESQIRRAQALEQSDKLSESAAITIKQLSRQLDANPFDSFFDQAEIRLDQFRKQFGSLGDDIVNRFKQTNDQVLSLDIFKAGLAKQDRLASLLDSQEQLRAGLGGQALRDKFKERDSQRDAIIREIEQKRGQGLLSGQEQNSLLARLNALDNTSPLERLEREATARRIESDREALSRAGDDPLKQSLALDRLLSHTSDISKLSEDQINLRTEALQRRIEIENAAEEKKQAQEEKREKAEEKYVVTLESFIEAVKKGIGLDITIKDQGASASADLGTSPGANTLFGSRFS